MPARASTWGTAIPLMTSRKLIPAWSHNLRAVLYPFQAARRDTKLVSVSSGIGLRRSGSLGGLTFAIGLRAS